MKSAAGQEFINTSSTQQREPEAAHLISGQTLAVRLPHGGFDAAVGRDSANMRGIELVRRRIAL